MPQKRESEASWPERLGQETLGQDRPAVEAETMFRHLLAISGALAGQLDFQSAIQAISDEMAHFLPHDHIDVCILRIDRDIHVAYEAGFDTDWGRAETTGPVSFSPIRSVLRGTEPFLFASDATTDPRFQFDGAFNNPIFDGHLRSRIHVPLRVKGEIIGALSCSRHAAGYYRPDDIPVCQHVADILAPYFYALRAAEQAQQSAILEAEGRAREEGLRDGALRLTEELESERQRIGMDLHDQTLADITRLTRRLTHLQERSTLPGTALEPIVGELHDCMHSLRQIIDDARPNVLQLFGFSEGIEDLLTRSLQDTTTRFRLEDDSGGAVDRLDEALRVALFRIVQEAINNAAHHAEPSLIEVVLGVEDGTIGIEIRDNGIGFAAQQQRKRVGGLRNMQTRARLVSADFSIAKRTDGPGTRVSIRLPMGGRAGIGS